MRGPTWTQVEQTTKHAAGLVWATLELWLWGARPGALAFIATILGGSEVAKIARRIRGGYETSTGSPSPPSQSGS